VKPKPEPIKVSSAPLAGSEGIDLEKLGDVSGARAEFGESQAITTVENNIPQSRRVFIF
jgi:hypothetical protein